VLYYIPLTNSNREYNPKPLPKIKRLDNNKRYIPSKYNDKCEKEISNSKLEGNYFKDEKYKLDRE
jgi:hypothetical protein